MIEWLDEFYGSDDMHDTLTRTYLPLFTSYAATLTDTPDEKFTAALVGSFIDRYLGSSRAQLQEIAAGDSPLSGLTARFDEWSEKRPAKVAANETHRAANATALQQFRDSGVTKKVWAASAAACPFCSDLDGIVVEIDSDFVSPGDELNPEGAERPMSFTSSIGHPPIHQGCDCSVVAG